MANKLTVKNSNGIIEEIKIEKYTELDYLDISNIEKLVFGTDTSDLKIEIFNENDVKVLFLDGSVLVLKDYASALVNQNSENLFSEALPSLEFKSNGEIVLITTFEELLATIEASAANAKANKKVFIDDSYLNDQGIQEEVKEEEPITKTRSENSAIVFATDEKISANQEPLLDLEVSKTTNEDESTILSYDAFDPDGIIDLISVSALHGTVVINSDSTLTYTPDENYFGEDTIVMTVTDNSGSVSTQSSSITIIDVNDLPTIEILAQSVVEDIGKIIANAADIDGTIDSSILLASNGKVSIDQRGNIIYTPNKDFNGDDEVTLTVIDDDGGRITKSFDINVIAVNDAATIKFESLESTLIENDVSKGDVVATFLVSDIDGPEVKVSFINGNENNYYEISDGKILLTQEGVDLVNTGADLPTFTLSASDGIQTTAAKLEINPANTQDVNDEVILESNEVNTFTQNSATVGDLVVKYTTFDEDGDKIDVSLTNDVFYTLDNKGNVVLTKEGADAINEGKNLPDFKILATDNIQNSASEVSISLNDTILNQEAQIVIESVSSEFVEDSTSKGKVVATFSTSDNDGDEVSVSLSDTNNYKIVGNTVVLTQEGADAVNVGEDLPKFTLSATDNIQNQSTNKEINPVNTTDVNDDAVITLNEVKLNFTEDDTKIGETVAKVVASDEDDDVSLTLSDTTNYKLVTLTDGTVEVQLTKEGAELVNSGSDLPSFTVQANGITSNTLDPSVTTVNDDAQITLNEVKLNFTEDDTKIGETVAKVVASDEDDDVSLTLSDTTNYKLVTLTDGTVEVQLTKEGAELVNSGSDLPSFTVQANGITSNTLDPSVTTVNDDAQITLNEVKLNFTEDDTKTGETVAKVVASDEDDDVSLTLSDTTNYKLVTLTDGTVEVQLTKEGAELVNSGSDLPSFTVQANGITSNTLDPSVTTVNDDAQITLNEVKLNFTEDDTKTGETVAKVVASDEDDDVSLKLSDTTNYKLVTLTDGTVEVQLTKEGAELVNSGSDLPSFTVQANGITSNTLDPSVTTVNDDAQITLNEVKLNFTEDDTKIGETVAKVVASDEDDDVSLTLSDTTNYKLVTLTDGTVEVQLTKEGAELVNSGSDLPSFTVQANGITSNTLDPSVTTVNDDAQITLNEVKLNFTEDDTKTGETVAKVVASDEDDDVSLKLSDTTNYKLVTLTDGTVEVQLTKEGAELVNSGSDLPSFTVQANGITSNTLDPSVTTVNDDAQITLNEVKLNFTEDDTKTGETVAKVVASDEDDDVSLKLSDTTNYKLVTLTDGTVEVQLTKEGAELVNSGSDLPSFTVQANGITSNTLDPSVTTVNDDAQITLNEVKLNFTEDDTKIGETVAKVVASDEDDDVSLTLSDTTNYKLVTLTDGTVEVQLTKEGAELVNSGSDLPSFTVQANGITSNTLDPSVTTVNDDAQITLNEVKLNFTEDDTKTGETVAKVVASDEDDDVSLTLSDTTNYKLVTLTDGTVEVQLTKEGAELVNSGSDLPSFTVQANGITSNTLDPSVTTVNDDAQITLNEVKLNFTEDDTKTGETVAKVVASDEDDDVSLKLSDTTNYKLVTLTDGTVEVQLTKEGAELVNSGSDLPSFTVQANGITSNTLDPSVTTVNDDAQITLNEVKLNFTEDDTKIGETVAKVVASDEDDDVSLTLSDTTNYKLVTLTDGTVEVQLTKEGAELVNSGSDLPSFTVQANGITSNTLDPSVTTVNDDAQITLNEVKLNFTEDDTKTGETVAKVVASDEDDDVSLKLSDTTNYKLVTLTDGTVEVQLTKEGAELVNSGSDLPSFTVQANGITSNTLDPSVTTVNDDAQITLNEVKLNFTEDDTKIGETVAKVVASDEDDDVSLTLSDTTNYKLVTLTDGTVEVQLTKEGAELVNSGSDLPSFTVQANGITSNTLDPSVTTVNDDAQITLNEVKLNFTEDDTKIGETVAKVVASDEDDDVSLTLSDTTNYKLVTLTDGTVEVQLTKEGAELVNSGSDLPSFTVQANGITSNTLDPSVTTVNDDAQITLNEVKLNFTEDDTKTGETVAKVVASDEDDDVSLTLSDTTNYKLVTLTDGTVEVQLTKEGAELVNSGSDLPSFTVQANGITSNTLDPSVTTVNDDAQITLNEVKLNFTEDDTKIGETVAKVVASDEDDDVSLTLSDTTNYKLVTLTDGTVEVQLTKEGAELVNSGSDLPSFTVQANGITSNTLDPSVTTVNDDAQITLNEVKLNFTEDDTKTGETVAKVVASDEDDDVSLTLSDTTNYKLVTLTDGTVEVQLTKEGAELVNSGSDLPSFTVQANGITSNTLDPSVTTVNDDAQITLNEVKLNFTEDDTKIGETVAKVVASDEDDDVSLTLSDTTNYKLVTLTDGTVEVQLTKEGAELVNSGSDLPSFTVQANGITSNTLDPSVTTVNDDAQITLNEVKLNFTEDDTKIGETVAKVVASDEDDDVSLTLSDTTNYKLVTLTDGTVEVQLTKEGAELVNSGSDLPSFTVQANGITSNTLDPSVTTVNDDAQITLNEVKLNFTEDDTKIGETVAKVVASDEDDDVSLTLSDTTNYKLVTLTDGTVEVQLTKEGAELVNSGSDLPSFTVQANGITSNTLDPSVTTVNDDAQITLNEVKLNFTEDDTKTGETVAKVVASDEDDDVSLKLSDTTNYKLVTLTDGTVEVQLTKEGAELVNSGSDLPSFTVQANGITSNTLDPSVTTVNDDAQITLNEVKLNFTEDDTKIGETVAKVVASDEDDDVSLTLSDTTNYKLVTLTDGTVEVQLTKEGAELVNSGSDLPSFTVQANGITSNTLDPSVTTVNDDAQITLNEVKLNFTEDDTKIGETVAKVVASDEDDDVSLTLSDTTNYKLVTLTDGTVEVQLTKEGAELVNSGSDLPSFTVQANGITSNTLDPSVTTVNDDAQITLNEVKLNFTEDDTKIGETVAKVVASDEDDDVSLTLSDTTNYKLVTLTDGTVEVQLTKEGAELVNSGSDLPSFTVQANGITSNTLDPSVTTVNDDAVITVTAIEENFVEKSTKEGAKVASIKASDEDDDITLSLSDTVNYKIVEVNGVPEVQLTQAGAALVNTGADLPNFTVDANGITSNIVDPANTTDTVAHAQEDYAQVNEDGTVIINVLANDEEGSIITSVDVPVNKQGEALGTVEIVTVDGIQQIKFTPSHIYDALNEGSESGLEFNYQIKDSSGNSGESRVIVDVTGVNNDLTYVSEAAGYANVVGYYEIDSNGKPTGEVHVVIDDQHGMKKGEHLSDMDPDVNYGFFIIANGAGLINESSVITFDTSSDTPVLLINGSASTKPVYHDNPEFNADGKDHFVFSTDGKGGTNINIEDLPNLGDADFGDVVLNVNFELPDIIGNDVTAKNDSVSIYEDQTIIIDVIRNDKDATGDTLEITEVQSPVMLNGIEVGTAVIENNKIKFTPNDEFDSLNTNESKTVTFTYSVSDGQAGSDTASVSIAVHGTDDITTLKITAKEVTEDLSKEGSVVATFDLNDKDNNVRAEFTDGSNSENYYILDGNEVKLTALGEEYLDAGNTLPSISLTSSGSSTNITTLATPTTILVNDAPIAQDDNFGTETIMLGSKDQVYDFSAWNEVPGAQDGAMQIKVGNLSGTISGYSGGELGQLAYYSITGNGVLDVGLGMNAKPGSPESDYLESNRINYDEKIVMDFDSSIHSADIGVSHLTHGFDEGSSVQWIAYENGLEVARGSVASDTLNNDGDNDLTTNKIHVEATFDKIEFSLLDETNGAETWSSFTINYIQAEHNYSIVEAIEDTVLNIDSSILLQNDSDEDGDKLSIVSVSKTDDTHGEVSVDLTGNIIFVPEANYSGAISFTYTISDGNGEQSTATVSLNVKEVNDAPVITPLGVQSVDEDSAIQGKIIAVDEEGDSFSFALKEGTIAPTGFVLNEDGSYTFDADSYDSLNESQNQKIQLEIVVTDSKGASSQSTLVIDVNGVNNDVTYVGQSASFNNVIGYYEIDENGNPLGESIVIVDNQHNLDAGEHLADMNPNKEYGFFIIVNGAHLVNDESKITFDTSLDTPVLLINGTSSSKPVYWDNPTFNSDGKDHFILEDDGKGGTTIRVEDLPNLGDADFGDVVFNVNFKIANKMSVDSDLVDASDTGVSNKDDITSDDTPTITGNTESGAMVVITLNGIEVGRDEADLFGNYSITTSALEEGNHSLLITSTDSSGTSVTSTQEVLIDYSASEINKLSITNIVDTNGDYSSVTMSGTGAEVGNTIYLYDENKNQVASTFVKDDGTWNIDISDLKATKLNDNEFFFVKEMDTAGNLTDATDTTHYWHGTGQRVITEDYDDYVMTGDGNDYVIHDKNSSLRTVSGNDDNDFTVIDMGDGRHDKIEMGGRIEDYIISKNEDGDVTLREIVDSSRNIDDNNDSLGDLTILKNVELIKFSGSNWQYVTRLDYAPETQNASFELEQSLTNSYNFNLESSISDVNGGTLSIKITSLPSDGEIRIGKRVLELGDIVSENSEFTYFSNNTSSNNASFTYSALDNTGLESDVSSVSLNIIEASASAPKLEIIVSSGLKNQDSTHIDHGNDYGKDNTIKGSYWEHNEVLAGTSEDDKIILKDGNNKSVISGEGNDYIKMAQGNNIRIDSQEGDDLIKVQSYGNQLVINTGLGDDRIEDNSYVDHNNSSIDTGSGNDYVQMLGGNNISYTLGEGNDIIENKDYSYYSSKSGFIDGEDGNDTLILKGNSSDYKITDNLDGTYKIVSIDYWNNETSLFNVLVKNIENLKFDDKTITLEESISSYTYSLTLYADLSDTDGSETLSSLSVKLPSGVSIRGIEANDDGSYTVPTNEQGVASVHMDSTRELSTDERNSIQGSVTATEEQNNDTNTLTKYGAGDDEVVFGVSESIDAGEGKDTLIIEDDMILDFASLAQNVRNIEALDLSNNQADSLTNVQAQDVLKMTDDENILKIIGDKGDEIGLSDDNTSDDNWIKSDAKITDDGEVFNVWTNDDITLYIDEDITVTDI